jgi:hypothetical protein
MIFKPLVSLALASSLVAAGPVEHEMIKAQTRKRQETGAIGGLPSGLQSLVPMVSNAGMLPNIVKTLINSEIAS